MPFRPALTCGLIAAAVLGLVGCGGGGARTQGASDPQAQLKYAVRTYSDAYLAGNGLAAHDLLSARCQQAVPQPALTQLVLVANKTYGPLPLTTLTVDQLDGPMARVSYTYSVPVLNQTGEPWVQENGQWRQDDC